MATPYDRFDALQILDLHPENDGALVKAEVRLAADFFLSLCIRSPPASGPACVERPRRLCPVMRQWVSGA
jgi:hypothetical protein